MSRQAMQQALEALECLYNDTEIMVTQDQYRAVKIAIATLKQALLIDVSPAQMAHADAVAEPEQPVAWADDVGVVIPHSHKLFAPDLCEKYIRPLYAAPTPRKPLTDEEIDQVTLQQWGEMWGAPLIAHRAYARAVIAAYEAKQGEQHGS